MAVQVPAPDAVAVEAERNGHPPVGSESPTRFWALTIGSVGVVYGDIGTSPLYAFREAARAAARGGTAGQAEVFGVLSLIFWALTIIVTLKYVLFLMRVDNHGEGGTLALMALAQRRLDPAGRVGREVDDPALGSPAGDVVDDLAEVGFHRPMLA